MMWLRVIKLAFAVVFLFVWGSAVAADNLYIFVFKDGVAMQDVTVKVGEVDKTTNEYGLANFSLPSGEYEVGYYRNNKLFALTDVLLPAEQQSQIFLELTKAGADVELDLPLSKYAQRFDQQQVKAMHGPKGTLKLKLVDDKEGTPIAGARLFFKGYAVEAQSDKNGIATVELAKGHYDISVVHPKYVMHILRDISITANSTSSIEESLSRANIVMNEYVVSAPAVEGSLASTFAGLKESDVIGDALSSEQFSKSGDSSAADALKRVTGISVVDDKYVYVRGLGERYSMVMLNGMLVPSPEPTKRVVPLDIFPSGVIQSMNIQKTYSPDLPGTFAGGDVLIVSKDIPEEDNYAKLSIGGSVNSSTGKEVYYNEDNAQGLPDIIITNSDNFQELQQGFPDIGVPGYTAEELHEMTSQIVNYRRYNLQKTTLKPGSKVALDVGQSFKTPGGLKYGVAGTVYLSSDAKAKDATKYSSYYDIPSGVLTAGERSDYQHTVLNDKQGGLLSFSLDNQSGHKIKYTLLGLDDKSSATTYSEKDGGPAGPGIDDQHRTYYEYVEKQIVAHQLSGEHLIKLGLGNNDLLDDMEINWGAETAEATRKEPGTVEYYYERTSDVTDYTLNKKIWYLYSDLKDDVNNFRVDFKLPYRFNDSDNYTKFGYFGYSKSRTLDNRRFKLEHDLGTDVFDDIDDVLTQGNVDSGDLELTSNYRPADAYTATQDLNAFYVNQSLSVLSNLDLLAGLRHESSTQQLIDTQSGVPYDPLITDDNLALLGINYSINDKNKIRFAFANTLSRPDFREFSPNRYKDPITEDIVFGYPELKYTTIDNTDLKYEWYISYDEIFTFGLFQKEFTNPVETIVNQDPDSQSGKKIISYRNALGATSQGTELSFRKKLGFLGSAFSNFFVESNYAVINSNIRLDSNSDDVMISELTSKNRPMQGQSPYVINFNIGYDNINTGRSVVLLYNEFGKRITGLGSYGAPDYYEYPFRKLDFVLKWRFNDTYDVQVKKIGYGMDLKINNILDSTVEVRQGSEVVESYKPGVGFSLTFWMKY